MFVFDGFFRIQIFNVVVFINDEDVVLFWNCVENFEVVGDVRDDYVEFFVVVQGFWKVQVNEVVFFVENLVQVVKELYFWVDLKFFFDVLYFGLSCVYIYEQDVFIFEFDRVLGVVGNYVEVLYRGVVQYCQMFVVEGVVCVFDCVYGVVISGKFGKDFNVVCGEIEFFCYE